MKKFVKVLGGIFLSLGIIILAGFIYESISGAMAMDQYPPPGKLVEVGENTLHINVMGESTMDPTIIIETGSGSFSNDWLYIQNELAKHTRVVTYDRAGYGWSYENQTERSAEQIVKELVLLLEKEEIHGPYILVGHSLGGLYMRTFISENREDVVGLVLVDARPPGFSDLMDTIQSGKAEELEIASIKQNEMASLLQPFGVFRLFKGQLLEGILKKHQNVHVNVSLKPKQFKAISEEINYVNDIDSIVEDQSFDNIPVTAIMSSNGIDFTKYGFSTEEALRIERYWVDHQHKVVSDSYDGEIIQVKGGHNLMFDNPTIIIDSILNMIKKLENERVISKY